MNLFKNWLQRTTGVLVLGSALAFAPASAEAAGLLVADGGFGGVLEIKEHDVKVTINNGIAVTHVTQVFLNKEKRQVEALYTFPVPRNASVANFSMWINGKEMVGEVLEKKRAREIYDSYKAVRRDPGLLEQKDYRTFEMRIFPIAAGAEQKVQISYYQELESDQDWSTYVYPLATSTQPVADSRVSGRFSISFDLKSLIPVKAVASPSHADDFVFVRHSDTYQQASMEVNGGSIAKDVVLSAHLVRPTTGLDLVTSAKPGEDGYFALTFSAGEDLAASDQGMDYVFVLDTSGSMSDAGKLLLSKDCVNAFIAELGDKDRFEVMTFNVSPSLAFSEMRGATPENKHEAMSWLDYARAAGGTVLEPALSTAYKYATADRPLNVVILSDGLTEQSERAKLLRLIGQRPGNTKVFCVGVGNDVNRPLLEQVAQDSGGLAAFMSRSDDAKRQAAAFRRKLLRPVAEALQIEFSGLQVTDVEPSQIPNLYHGAPVRIYGRYRGNGTGTVKIRGSVNGVAWAQTAALEFPAEDTANPEIERMWALKRIDGLLKEGDRAGNREPAIPEIVRLGEGFSIVTEYTSFLVLENDGEYQRWKIDRKNVARVGRDRAAQTSREQQLESIRSKAALDLGPQPLLVSKAPTPQPTAAAPIQNQPQQSAPVPASTPRQSFDLGFGSGGRSSGGGGGGGGGPVGPLFVIFSALLARRQRKN
jgi:Ca-activated chloride channel family protein